MSDLHLNFAQWIGSYRLAIWVAGILAVIFTLYFGVQGSFLCDQTPIRLVIYTSSVQEEVLSQGIFPALEESWETEMGSNSGHQILISYFLYESEPACQSISGTSDVFTVEDMGGWRQVYLDLMKNFWIPEIEPFLDLEIAPLVEIES